MRWLDSITDSVDLNLSNLGDSEGQGSLAVLQLMGHKELDRTLRLNNKSQSKGYQLLIMLVFPICPFLLKKKNQQWNWSLGQFRCIWVLPGSSVIKNLLAMQKTQDTWVPSLGQEDPLEEGMSTLSSILAQRILWTEEPGRLQSIGSQRVKRD